MEPDRCHAKAKTLLQQHFRNEQKIASAYMEKVISCSSVKSDDTSAVGKFCLFLRGCNNAMEEVQYMDELNMPAS